MSGKVIGNVVTVKRSRKPHRCFWCGEAIDVGSTYVYWKWAANRCLEMIKCHPECRDAWHRAADECGGFYETMPYDNERGEASIL